MISSAYELSSLARLDTITEDILVTFFAIHRIIIHCQRK